MSPSVHKPGRIRSGHSSEQKFSEQLSTVEFGVAVNL